MEFPDIRSLIPHTGPMVLLDQVISVDEDSLCGEVGIRRSSLFCDSDGVGAWVGIEYIAQAIAAYAGYTARLRGEPVKIGLLLGIRRYECSRPVFKPGAILRVNVQRVFQSESGLGVFDCRIDDEAGGNLATATVTVFQPGDLKRVLDGSSQ
ncbi:MAG TPA: 3-hydroxylacyl-ACP dehydratase [Candidatus Binatia bacterium]|nr:3-hydroxylacyl-ACP dehydratase [Candidatus Binatia bacterium]